MIILLYHLISGMRDIFPSFFDANIIPSIPAIAPGIIVIIQISKTLPDDECSTSYEKTSLNR